MRFTPWILLASCATAVAQDRPPIATDRPGFSDGSNLVAPGILQLEAGFFRSQKGNQNFTSLGDALFRFGVNQKCEARVIGITYGFAPNSTRDLLDPSIGFKYRLSERNGELTFIGQSTIPVGESNLRSNEWNATGKLAFTKAMGAWTFGSNLVISQIGSGSNRFDQTALSLFFPRTINSQLTLTPEFWGVNRTGQGASSAAFTSIAGTYLVDNDTQLDLRIGTGFNQVRDGWFIQGGFSVRF